MLRTADSFVDEVIYDAAPCGVPSSPLTGAARELAPLATGGRYGERRRISLPALVLTIALHVALLGGLLHLQFRAEERKVVKLISVNLTPEAPPPAPPAEQLPDTARSPIVAPRPPIEVPRPAPLIAVAPEPSPVTIAAPPAPAPPAPPAPPSVIKSDNLAARMLSGRPPRYPTESRRKREQGTVLLSLTLGTDGSVAEISIARSSGFERLDKAARDAVRHWRWAPIKRDGQPVMVRGVVEIPFVLQD